MDRKFGSFLLLNILVPYILSWSEFSGIQMITVAAGAENTGAEYQIVNEINPVTMVFNQPAGQSSPSLPIKFISAQEQKLLHSNLQPSEPDYYKKNIFYRNQPIPTYKISLSVFTSDG